jgi:predicted HTH domain antitoxin
LKWEGFGILNFIYNLYNRVAVKIEIEIPVSEGTLDADAQARLRKDVLEAAVLRLFGERRITAVQAESELGLTRIAFMELTRQRSVPMYDYTFEHWQEDMKDLDLLRPEIEKNVRDSGARRLR